jgi:hypothetical protein
MADTLLSTTKLYSGAVSTEAPDFDFMPLESYLPGTYVLSSTEGLGEYRFIESLEALNNGFSLLTEEDFENFRFQYGRGPDLIVRETVLIGWSGDTIPEYSTLYEETNLPPRGVEDTDSGPDFDFTEPVSPEMDLSDGAEDAMPVSIPVGTGPGSRRSGLFSGRGNPQTVSLPPGFGPSADETTTGGGSGPGGISDETELDNTEITEVPATPGIKKLSFDFYKEKADRLKSLYGADPAPLSLPFIELPPASRLSYNIEAQNKIQNNIISYNSLSSLGEPVIEDLNVSSQGGTLTVGTTSETEVVEDVGGVTSFARGVPEDDGVDATGARGTRTVSGESATVYRGY